MSAARSRFWFIYRMPLVLALFTLLGLTSGVLGDGVWDAVSWLGLGVPIVVIGWFMVRPAKAFTKPRAASSGQRIPC